MKNGFASSIPEFTITGSAPDSINSLPDLSEIKIPVSDSWECAHLTKAFNLKTRDSPEINCDNKGLEFERSPDLLFATLVEMMPLF